jgi:hypothetical protein
LNVIVHCIFVGVSATASLGRKAKKGRAGDDKITDAILTCHTKTIQQDNLNVLYTSWRCINPFLTHMDCALNSAQVVILVSFDKRPNPVALGQRITNAPFDNLPLVATPE